MGPASGLDGGFDNLAALASAVAVLVAVCVAVERMLVRASAAVDAFRGRDHCRFCGARLPLRDGIGHHPRCRSCERNQPWS
jgi:hypothetical protein